MKITTKKLMYVAFAVVGLAISLTAGEGVWPITPQAITYLNVDDCPTSCTYQKCNKWGCVAGVSLPCEDKKECDPVQTGTCTLIPGSTTVYTCI